MSILLTVGIAFSAFGASAQNEVREEWRRLVPGAMQSLPEPILKWYITETTYLSRSVDPVRIASPAENNQSPFYKPESKNVFEVRGFWIPADQLKTFQSPSGEAFDESFVRFRNNQKEILFLVHPESYGFYEKLLQPSMQQETFLAAATSSSRSLLVWKRGQERMPFIAKLSLNQEIAKVVRTIKGTETAMSVGTSQTLEGSKNLPDNFLFMKESFSVIPKGFERGGMILREFPKEMLDQKSYFIPFFALYGGERPGFLLTAIRKSNLSPEQYIREKLLRPFAKLWADLAIKHGILMEPHAQNMLVEIRNGELTNRFLARDFGGFVIDFAFRRKRALFVPKDLPTFAGSIRDEYYQNRIRPQIREGLAIFYEGGFLYNVDRALKEWSRKKWIQKTMNLDLSEMFTRELESELKNLTGHTVRLGPYYEGLDAFVLAERASRSKAPLCSKVYW